MTREMKDSGIEWIGQIPKSWAINRIKFLANDDANSFIDGDWIESPYIAESGIRYLTTGNIGDGVFKNQGDGFISLDTFKNLKCKYAYPEDLVFSRLNAPYGRSCLLPKTENEFVLAVDNVILRTGHNKKFICYLTQCEGYQHSVEDLSAGTTMKRISRTNLGKIKLPIPPKEEQKEIANFLDSKCSQIDSLLSQIQEQIDTLEQYKKSVITEAVIKGLNRDVEMKDSGIEWASKIPSHWQSMPNKYIMTKVKNLCSKYSGENILSLTMNGVIIRDLEAGGKMPTSFDGYQFVYPGNLLMCLFDYDVTPRCIGLVKNEGITSPAYSQFEIRNGNYAPYYYYYYLMIDNTKELLHLAKNLRHSFTEEQLGAICVPVPPVQEQKQIVEYLDNKCSQIDSIISDKKKQLETLEQYKKSLIYEYVTGKKEVK